jgi:hypothetical protein
MAEPSVQMKDQSIVEAQHFQQVIDALFLYLGAEK